MLGSSTVAEQDEQETEGKVPELVKGVGEGGANRTLRRTAKVPRETVFFRIFMRAGSAFLRSFWRAFFLPWSELIGWLWWILSPKALAGA